MKLGIIGKPQSGKTTIFNAVAGQTAAVGDYSQAVHRAVIKVPDSRVDQLTELMNPKKVTYAEIEFLDAAGFSGKGKKASDVEISSELRMMEALTLVVDGFSADNDPAGDIQDLVDEMTLADQVLIESNVNKKGRKSKLTGDKSMAGEIELLKRCQSWLEDEKLLIDLELSDSEEKQLRGFTFLTQKPLLIVVNIDEDRIPETDAIRDQFSKWIVPGKRDIVVMCGKIQMDLVGLDAEEKQMFLDDLGIADSATDRMIHKSYELLGLISFLTGGDPEVRAWTIKKGTIALHAAGVIHSDIERGFIRAEVTAFDDYIEHKTAAALKAAGKTRLEGKEYVMRDGDVLLFRFNV